MVAADIGRRRVAWVTAEPPHFTRSGGNIRQAFLLEALSRAADVHLFVYGHLDDERVRSACTSVTELPARPLTEAPPWRRRLTNLRRCLPGAAPHEVDESRPARRALGRALRAADVDVVLVEHAGLAPLARRRRPGQRWALTLHFLPSGTMAQWAAVATTAAQRLVRTREVAAARRFEARLASLFDVVLTVSDDDAAGLPGPSVVIPNGVAVDDHDASPVPRSSDIVFVGRLDFLPNADGVCWFADEVLPRVRASQPDARLVVVGRDPAEEVRRLGERDGIVVHPNVPDVRPYLRDARVSVVPLRLGTGTRLKALEALAAARPVVGTTIGLAGLGLTSDHAVITDHADAFAAAVVELLRDDAKAAAMASAGRDYVAAHFSWDHIAPSFVAALFGASSDRGEAVADQPDARRISA